ncbi:MAG TPA: TIGR03620 family F420-dependent LLM class oxidoreductase [Pseudonocardiaceae bacterium]|nr:TIGR03620 family F420-dependent LLM class oxidoreductase [Pseudonocardiaceae bacterium]
MSGHLRDTVGRLGVWCTREDISPALAAEIERLGYGTIWIGRADGDLCLIEELLNNTGSIVVATGIVNIWRYPARDVAAAYHRVESRHPGRMLLGIGVGHPETNGDQYRKPYTALCRYLDELDAAGVPVSRRVLAALGPRVLRLAAERAAGAHPYLVPVEHTRFARQVMGADALLAPEQRIVLDTDPVRARTAALAAVSGPLSRVNYATNLRRLGYDGPPSDQLLDRLVRHGDATAISYAIAEHLLAGADHVAVHVLSDQPLRDYTTIADQFRGEPT